MGVVIKERRWTAGCASGLRWNWSASTSSLGGTKHGQDKIGLAAALTDWLTERPGNDRSTSRPLISRHSSFVLSVRCAGVELEDDRCRNAISLGHQHHRAPQRQCAVCSATKLADENRKQRTSDGWLPRREPPALWGRLADPGIEGPLRRYWNWSMRSWWLRETVCLGHEGELSLKFLTFSSYFVW